MTSKLTREENVQAVFDLKAGYTLGLADVEILKRVARMALAAMDSKPVAWQYRVSAGPATGWSLWHDGKGEQYENSYKVERRPLYRHAQQPVMHDRSIFEKWWESQNGAPLDGWGSLRATDGYCDDGIDGQFEAWSAAMLAAAPQEVK